MRFRLDDAIPILAATPRVLRAWLAEAGEPWTRQNYGRRVYDDGEKETWSPFEILGHLIHAEQTGWIPRARHILAHGETAPFAPFDRDGHRDAIRGRSVADLLDEFDGLRGQSLDALRTLPLDEAALARRGTHPALGTVTLAQLLATWMVHDLTHLHQIALAMAHQYAGEVGPWRAYLSILRR